MSRLQNLAKQVEKLEEILAELIRTSRESDVWEDPDEDNSLPKEERTLAAEKVKIREAIDREPPVIPMGNLVEEFVREHCVVDESAGVWAGVLYHVFYNQCMANGNMPPGNSGAFGRQLRKVVPNMKSVRQQGGIAYHGIGFKPQESPQ